MKRLLLGILLGLVAGIAFHEAIRTPTPLAVAPEAVEIPVVLPLSGWVRFKRWTTRTRIAVKRFVKFGLIAGIGVVAVQAISPAGLAGLFMWENIAVVLVAATLAAVQKFLQPGDLTMAVNIPQLTLTVPAVGVDAVPIKVVPIIEGVDK